MPFLPEATQIANSVRKQCASHRVAIAGSWIACPHIICFSLVTDLKKPTP